MQKVENEKRAAWPDVKAYCMARNEARGKGNFLVNEVRNLPCRSLRIYVALCVAAEASIEMPK